ncbi:MAG: UDP-N-acetylmuramoyl-tripeptide--D-alanyl-D-alanine ligase [Pseudomonadota bacterium]
MTKSQPINSPLWTAQEALAVTRATPHGEHNWVANSFNTDTRSLAPGEIFVALKDIRDGHDFLGAAAKAGAVAAIVSRVPEDVPGGLPLLEVDDTLAGLSALAAAARDRNFGKLIAVTGSVGKTSTKDMLRTALGAHGSVHAAAKSFNNHIGVPITVAGLPASAQYGVFEIGMNHSGEITPLVALVKPHVAIITTVAAVHLEAFNSVQEIAAAKAEILTGMRPNGTAVLPADNSYFPFLTSEAERLGISNIIPFGESDLATSGVRLTEYTPTLAPASTEAKVSGTAFGEPFQFTLHAPGKHQAMNAMAVIAAAICAGAPLDCVLRGIEAFRPSDGRGAEKEVTLEKKRIRIIDESYNANPLSMEASLGVLAGCTPGAGGRRVAVLGEMMELGPTAPALHAGLLAPIEAAGVSRLFLLGEGMTPLAQRLPKEIDWDHEKIADVLLNTIEADLKDGDVMLFKGSKASGLGNLLNTFLAKVDGAS